MFYALEFALIYANRINAAKTQSRVKYAHYTQSAGNIYIYIYIYDVDLTAQIGVLDGTRALSQYQDGLSRYGDS